MVQKIGVNKPQTAWAIFIKDDDGEYMFHSAHWSKARAKEMLWHEWEKPKIVKIYFTFDKMPNVKVRGRPLLGDPSSPQG